MAVMDKVSSQLRLVLQDGNDEETGKPIYKYKSFNQVKTDTNADQLFTVAMAISGLQERSLYAIERKDGSIINQE